MFKINTYDGGKVAKVFYSEQYRLSYGTVMDLFEIFDVEKLENGNTQEIEEMILRGLPKMITMVKPILLDIFPDMTSEDIKHCDFKEVARVVIDALSYAISEMTSKETPSTAGNYRR